SCDGESVIAVGTTLIYRLRLDREGGRLVVDDQWCPSYGPSPGRSYGWDPVITDQHILWMDNGRNQTDRTMLTSGDSPDPSRLWWVRRDDASRLGSVQISGLAFGTQSNPPAWDRVGGVVVAYDAANAVLRAWRLVGDELQPLWRRDNFAHAGHLILLVRIASNSARARRASLATGHDQLVVLDLDNGEDKARVDIPSPSQGFLFPAPGFERDIYYQSLTTIARVVVTGAAT
ncbi:MAG: hypothetical protein NTV40_05110, partial [Solirubrobacterales bacterium]|nr:hypothetical protein [Solirubrobacterales bacterium]